MKKIQTLGPRRISVLYPLPSTVEDKTDHKKRVAAYCRVSSSSDEQLESYKAQISYYEKYIKNKEDYSFAGIYADEGISGTSIKKRDAFRRMIEDAKGGHIDMIITKSISRFGRNTVDCLKTIRLLKEYAVDVYFEKENIHTMRNDGEILITLLSAFSQQESIAHSENVKWGKRRKYERGDIGCIAWKNITGYDRNSEGEVVIVDEQAAIVCRVFREFLQGYGPDEIARRLNQENGMGTVKGKQWRYKQILNLLENEKYKGDVRFQLWVNQDPLTKKRVRNNGELPQYYCKNTHPAIIDKEIWNCVQLELKRQKKFCKDHFMTMFHHSTHKATLPLTGKIICSNCGYSFKIKVSGRLIDKGMAYYRCSNYRSGYRIPKKAGCDCVNEVRLLPVDAEEAFVKAWNHLVDYQEHYLPEWQQIIDGDDILKAYRTKELMRMLEETGYIETMPYELMLKTLDHIEIDIDGKVDIIFLAGMRFKG